MSFTTYANGLSVATQGTNHMARCTEPDVLKDPKNTPVPHFNYILTTELGTKQTTCTTVQGFPIWTAPGLLDKSPSCYLGAFVGVNGGVTSGVHHGYAEATSYSGDVLVEGNGVVRMTDTTKQNKGNCAGIVDNAANLANFLDDLKDKATDDGKEKTTGGGEPPKETKPPEKPKEKTTEHGGDKKKDETTSTTEEKCSLKTAQITCSHGRPASSAGLLEVVQPDFTSSADEITMVATMEDKFVCPNGTHPEWAVSGWLNGTHQGKLEAKQKVSGRFSTMMAGGLPFGLLYIPPAEYSITCTTCEGATPQKFNVRVYPGGKQSVTISGSSDTVNAASQLLNKLAKTIESALGCKAEVTIFSGSLEISLEWKEHSDHRAFCGLHISGGFTPILGISLDKDIPWGPIEPVRVALQKTLDKVNNWLRKKNYIKDDIALRLYAFASFGVSLTVDASYRFGMGTGWTWNGGKASIDFSIGIALKLTTGTEFLSVKASISAGISGEYEISPMDGGKGIDQQFKFTFGKLGGSVELTAKFGKIPFTDWEVEVSYKKEVVFFEGFKWESDKRPFMLF